MGGWGALHEPNFHYFEDFQRLGGIPHIDYYIREGRQVEHRAPPTVGQHSLPRGGSQRTRVAFGTSKLHVYPHVQGSQKIQYFAYCYYTGVWVFHTPRACNSARTVGVSSETGINRLHAYLRLGVVQKNYFLANTHLVYFGKNFEGSNLTEFLQPLVGRRAQHGARTGPHRGCLLPSGGSRVSL